MFDVAIVGAGICGCSSAYMLSRAGLRVALIDATGIAAGGSGAAGAFVSPKFVKSGPVKEVSEAAFRFSLAFYQEHFGGATSVSSLLHYANSALSNERVAYFKQHTSLSLIALESDLLKHIEPQAQMFESLVLESSAVVDAHKVCNMMASEASFFKIHVNALHYDEGFWNINNKVRAKRVVLTTGAYDHVIDIPYFTPRAVFGHRISVKTSSCNPLNLHQFVSISQSNSEGVIAIGATHDVHYNPQHSATAYDVAAGREELLEKARRTMKLNNVTIIEDFTGVRAGSVDHLPLLGLVVDSKKTLSKLPKLRNGKKYNINKYEYYPHLFMMNGVGGYGFVLAPYLAKTLRDYMLENSAISPLVLPSRFLRRWIIQQCH